MTSFNKNRYVKLLLQNKHSKPESMELLSYKVILENTLIYSNRYKYLSLVEKLFEEVTNKSPNLEKFNDLEEFNFNNLEKLEDFDLLSTSGKISTLIEKDVEDLAILEHKIRKEGITILDNFQINVENSKRFRSKLEIIDCFFDDVNSEEEYGLFVDIFPSVVKDCLSYLRYYANPDSGLSKDNQILREIMIFFTIITGITYTFLNPSLFNLIYT